MSFIPLYQQVINSRTSDDPVRITLEFMQLNSVGSANSTALGLILNHLATRGVVLSREQFQQTILAESRSKGFFIGSGSRGYYLIKTIDDAKVMARFYNSRLSKLQNNLGELRNQSSNVGWTGV